MIGPLMVDLVGTELTEEEETLLSHSQVGGVILFSRNYQTPSQLATFVQQIRQINPQLLIAVDQEGGRVQRFREGFTRLPAMAQLGQCYQHSPDRAIEWATACGEVLATELLSSGIDFSFTPVLDLDLTLSQVIGDRAFASDPKVVAYLSAALMVGLARVGMAAVGKHFPGHGGVIADSHHAIPHCAWQADTQALIASLYPFQYLIRQGLKGMMPAHIIFDHLDPNPPCFSHYWLQHGLRKRLAFGGAIFSDDLSMVGASVAGDFVARSQLALDRGCDMILVCNHRSAVWEIVAQLHDSREAASSDRLEAMRPHRPESDDALAEKASYQFSKRILQNSGELSSKA